MALKENKNLKLFRTIKEVAREVGVSESTLRFWETEIPQLSPKTRGDTKVRQYSDKDVELVRLIHNLVKVRGFKLSAARAMIAKNRAGVDKQAEVLETLISIRDELKTLRRQLDELV